ncbi:hypothetical protein [Aerococcus viridans]|uniref:hypothetical protein n=1 Tax=Aerococcus TaxID=1375 RepID=UPI003B219396
MSTGPEVTALFDQYCQDIVYIIHTLQISLDLDRVVLGGGISAQPLVLKGVQDKYDALRRDVPWFNDSFESVEIGLCKYGSEANLIGAVYQLLIEE